MAKLLWQCVGNTAIILLCVFTSNYIWMGGLVAASCAERHPEDLALQKAAIGTMKWSYFSNCLQTPPQLFWNFLGIDNVMTHVDDEFDRAHAWIPMEVPTSPVFRPENLAFRAIIFQGIFWIVFQLVSISMWRITWKLIRKEKTPNQSD